jgi:hypothetical protein
MAATLTRQGARIVSASRDPEKGEQVTTSIPAAAGWTVPSTTRCFRFWYQDQEQQTESAPGSVNPKESI